MLFPSEGKLGVVLEEDLEGDGVTLDASNEGTDKTDQESGAKQEGGRDSAEGKGQIMHMHDLFVLRYAKKLMKSTSSWP